MKSSWQYAHIGSGNGLVPSHYLQQYWTKFFIKNIHLKMLPARCQPFCSALNVLIMEFHLLP